MKKVIQHTWEQMGTSNWSQNSESFTSLFKCLFCNCRKTTVKQLADHGQVKFKTLYFDYQGNLLKKRPDCTKSEVFSESKQLKIKL